MMDFEATETYMAHSLSDNADSNLRFVTFFVGAYRFAFEARYLRSIQTIDEEALEIENLNTIEEFLGQSELTTKLYTHLLSFKNDKDEHTQISVNGPIELIDLSSDFIFPIPPLLKAGTIHPNVCALGQLEDNIFYLLKIK